MYGYGFQGQEQDDEVKGKGNSVSYKYRMHDPRIGRFFAVDPLAPVYPELTPYQFSSNNTTWFVEIEGLEGAPNKSSHTMFVYYVGGDIFDWFGIDGHTAIGYSGPSDRNPNTMYDPVGGSSKGNEEKRANTSHGSSNGGKIYRASEAKTILNYLNSDLLVQRIHYNIGGDVAEGLVNVLEFDISGGSQLDGWWCTGMTWSAIIEAYVAAGKTVDEATAIAEQIVWMEMPEESSASEVKESGSLRYDEFSKHGKKIKHDRFEYNKKDKKWEKQTKWVKTSKFVKYLEKEGGKFKPNKEKKKSKGGKFWNNR